jgi:hypothetical protein
MKNTEWSLGLLKDIRQIFPIQPETRIDLLQEEFIIHIHVAYQQTWMHGGVNSKQMSPQTENSPDHHPVDWRVIYK